MTVNFTNSLIRVKGTRSRTILGQKGHSEAMNSFRKQGVLRYFKRALISG